MISHEGKLYFPHKNEVARALDELVTFIGFPNVLHKPFLWLGIMVKTFVFSHSLKKESNVLTFDQRGADARRLSTLKPLGSSQWEEKRSNWLRQQLISYILVKKTKES